MKINCPWCNREIEPIPNFICDEYIESEMSYDSHNPDVVSIDEVPKCPKCHKPILVIYTYTMTNIECEKTYENKYDIYVFDGEDLGPKIGTVDNVMEVAEFLVNNHLITWDTTIEADYLKLPEEVTMKEFYDYAKTNLYYGNNINSLVDCIYDIFNMERDVEIGYTFDER